MMIFMHFTFQILLLAIGFGVGYGLLILSNNQEGYMKTIGRALGGVLIIMAMVLALFSCYYSMKIGNRGYMQSGCPAQRLMEQHGSPMMDNEDSKSDEGFETKEEQEMNDVQDKQERLNSRNRNMIEETGEDDVQKTKNVPVARDIDDHE